MKKTFIFPLISFVLSLCLSCNNGEKKETEKSTVDTIVRQDTQTNNPPEVENNMPPPQRENIVDPVVVSIAPAFDIEGDDGKDWNTEISLNILSGTEEIANFHKTTCCRAGKPFPGATDVTEWNPKEHIPEGVRHLPAYLLNKTNVTKTDLDKYNVVLGWRPDGRDECTGIRWTLTATFSDNSKAVYSHLETFPNTSAYTERPQLLKNCLR